VAAKGKAVSYIHGGSRIGVLVDVEGGDEALAKDLAMQIAASKPVSLDRTGVPDDLIEKERSIATQKAAESGKPADIVAKMVEGTVQKYLKEVTLLGQPFVKDDKLSIEKLLAAASAKVTRFERLEVGAGIEKKQEDFVAEVMAQAKGSGH
jgi:elongation factor Ts